MSTISYMTILPDHTNVMVQVGEWPDVQQYQVTVPTPASMDAVRAEVLVLALAEVARLGDAAGLAARVKSSQDAEAALASTNAELTRVSGVLAEKSRAVEILVAAKGVAEPE